MDTLARDIGDAAAPLYSARGKALFRGFAWPEERLAPYADWAQWDQRTNDCMAAKLVHNDYGLSSTTTVENFARQFAAYRHRDHVVDGIAARQVLLKITVDRERPARGFVLEQNFGEPLHEIQLARNDYRITGAWIPESGDACKIDILASGRD